MLWAKAATHHGRPIFGANGDQRGMNVSYVGRYVGLVQNRIQNMSMFTIGVNLVPPNSTSNSVETLKKNRVFRGGFGTIRGTTYSEVLEIVPQ